MPEDQRLAEDLEAAEASRKNKNKGQFAFLQKYHHKGAFYADQDILQRDYTAPTESTVTDISALPKVMQKRNFGKMSQTKYTHLAAEDTSSREAGWSRKVGSIAEAKRGSGGQQQGCFNCGGPHVCLFPIFHSNENL